MRYLAMAILGVQYWWWNFGDLFRSDTTTIGTQCVSLGSYFTKALGCKAECCRSLVHLWGGSKSFLPCGRKHRICSHVRNTRVRSWSGFALRHDCIWTMTYTEIHTSFTTSRVILYNECRFMEMQVVISNWMSLDRMHVVILTRLHVWVTRC